MTAAAAITKDEALALLVEKDLLVVGKMADAIRRQKHPDNRVSFVVDRNVNYTNVCESKCRFCAFYRNIDDSDAYVLAEEAIFEKIEELVAHNGTQLLMQGGTTTMMVIGTLLHIFTMAQRHISGLTMK